MVTVISKYSTKLPLSLKFFTSFSWHIFFKMKEVLAFYRCLIPSIIGYKVWVANSFPTGVRPRPSILYMENISLG
jgi:hypothetical protein